MKSFSLEPFREFKTRWLNSLRSEVDKYDKDSFLRLDIDEFKTYLKNKYELIPLEIVLNSEVISPPVITKEHFQDRFYGSKETEVYNFTITYNYNGTGELFRVEPNPWQMTGFDIDINSSKSEVSFKFKQYDRDSKKFLDMKKSCFERAFANLENVNKNIIEINRSLDTITDELVNKTKIKYEEENNFFKAINVQVNKDTESIFTPKIIEPIKIPQPVTETSSKKVNVPILDKLIYNDILDVIFSAGKNMESKPSLYISKDEESLRDLFLFLLETRYKGVTATGETFNREGKTDILLKFADDSSNVFVAECKIWHGVSEMNKAINQLFSYLTWRDSKVALILFVKEVNFTNILDKIKKEILTHELAVKFITERGDSSFSYEFHLPQDKEKKVLLEVIAFHFDKE